VKWPSADGLRHSSGKTFKTTQSETPQNIVHSAETTSDCMKVAAITNRTDFWYKQHSCTSGAKMSNEGRDTADQKNIQSADNTMSTTVNLKNKTRLTWTALGLCDIYSNDVGVGQ